jgi:NADH-quinone oxidoreductase subunit E
MMVRYDLRHLKENFQERMQEILKTSNYNEVVIFLFEIGDFSSVQASADLVKSLGHELMNSVKYNEADWTIVVKIGKL